jgi:hypothetical protein
MTPLALLSRARDLKAVALDHPLPAVARRTVHAEGATGGRDAVPSSNANSAPAQARQAPGRVTISHENYRPIGERRFFGRAGD